MVSKKKLIAETIFINRFWAWTAATIGFCDIRPAVLNFWFTAPPGSVCNLGLPFSWLQLKRPSQLPLQSTNGIYEFLLFHVGLFRFQYPTHISILVLAADSSTWFLLAFGTAFLMLHLREKSSVDRERMLLLEAAIIGIGCLVIVII